MIRTNAQVCKADGGDLNCHCHLPQNPSHNPRQCCIYCISYPYITLFQHVYASLTRSALRRGPLWNGKLQHSMQQPQVIVLGVRGRVRGRGSVGVGLGLTLGLEFGRFPQWELYEVLSALPRTGGYTRHGQQRRRAGSMGSVGWGQA